jgi:nitrogen fixation NifU-like protein
MNASLSAMYQDRLLAEYRAPKNRRELPQANGRAERKNPVCGDAFTVMIHAVDNRVVDVAFEGQGCSIAVASASLMTQQIVGSTIAEVVSVAASVDVMLASGASALLPALLEPLRGVAPFPARHGCALLPWQALRDAIRALPN